MREYFSEDLELRDVSPIEASSDRSLGHTQEQLEKISLGRNTRDQPDRILAAL